jgi:hypothetical protein
MLDWPDQPRSEDGWRVSEARGFRTRDTTDYACCSSEAEPAP